MPSTDPTPTADGTTDSRRPPTKPQLAIRFVLITVVLVFTVFWIWALFFASKEGVNRIGDRAWAERAEEVCAASLPERNALADFREGDADNPALVVERADLLDQATDIVEATLDEITATMPADEKGQAIVPLWEADYRTHLQDRRDYADELRRTGEYSPFYETQTDEGIPISEKVATFAVENDMPDCRPPTDL